MQSFFSILLKPNGKPWFCSLLVLLVLICNNASFGQWSYVAPPDPYYGANYLVDHNNELFLATNGDVFKSTNNGSSWINLSNGFITDPGNSNIYIQFAEIIFL